jgi:hypothetical protein
MDCRMAPTVVCSARWNARLIAQQVVGGKTETERAD